MAEYANDGFTLVYWTGSIASKAAPTVAEITAGTRISGFLTKDGLDIPFQQNTVDNADLEDTFDSKAVGTYGGDITLTMKRNNSADTAWNLAVYATAGFLVVRRGIAVATAIAASQKVEVYPGQMHEPVPVPTATNELAKFKLLIAVTDQPNLKATVAA